MSITFACGNCRKAFTLEDRFAGKKGKCKGCGAMMLIPASSPTFVSTSEPPSRPAPANLDAYGFEDDTRPSRSSLPSIDDEENDPLPPRQRIKEPRARFEPPQPRTKRRPARSEGLTGGAQALIVGFVLVVILGGVGGVMVHLRNQGWEMPDWLPSSSKVEAAIKQRLALHQQLLALLVNVVDVPSASRASVEVNGKFIALTTNLREFKVMRAPKTELERLKVQYTGQIDLVAQQVITEINRIASLPGVLPALHIEASAKALEFEEESIKQLQGLPATNPAPVIPPRFNPPPPPQSFPNQPGIPNRPGPSNRGRPNLPGPRFGRPNTN